MSENIEKEKDLEGGLKKALDGYHLNINEADAFLNTARLILEKNDFCACAHRIFDLCKEAIGATTGYLALLSQEGAKNEALFFESNECHCTVSPAHPMSIRGLKAEAYRLGRSVYENDFSHSKWMEYMPHGHVSLDNVLFTPLNFDKKTMGLIGLANKPGRFTERDAQLSNAFGEIAAIALLNCFTREALHESEDQFPRLSKNAEETSKIQKIESVGILAGGIAHDFNNLLTGILGNISLAKDMTTDKKLQEILKDAELATLRSKSLTQQLLTFSRGGEPIKKLTLLRKFLKDSVELTLRGSNVTYELSIPDGLWDIEIDEGYMTQAIKNLIINAVQAMTGGGIIHIIVENSSIDDHLLPVLKPGDYVKISIQDQGCGIAKDNLKKIFDPFFTTKKNQSGLGLSVAYSVIKKHGGYLMAESEVAAGSVFTFYLPVFHKEEEEERPVQKVERSHNRKILFMDDEEMLRKLVNGILNHLGYDVETVPDGVKAIESYKRAKDSGKPFDMVIMDLTVQGGMGGKEAIKLLLALDHEAKVIVSSGYAKDPIMAHFKDYGFSGVISKPYDMNKLKNVIDNTIDFQPNNRTHKYDSSQ